MAFGHSFTKFLNNNFIDELCNVASEYLNEHGDTLELKLRKVQEIGEIELLDTRINKVYVNDLPGTKIAFDVILELELEVREADYHFDESDTCTQWIRVPCTGDLSKDIKEWEIQTDEIEQYFKKNAPTNCLSDSLVPYISSEQLEDIATEFLESYYPNALSRASGGIPVKVDPFILAETLGLKVEQKVIRNDSVFGQIYFEDTDADVSDLFSDGSSHIRARTIVVDPYRFCFSSYGSINNTIIHECVHWVMHRKAFLLEKLFDSKISRITCEVATKTEQQKAQEELKFMEWQANQLAPRIQMPAEPFKARAKEYIVNLQRLNHAKYEFEVMEQVIDNLAQEFNVSRQSAKIRLVQLGFHQAVGAYTYVDGHYVKAHSFKPGLLKPNQTFSISAYDAAVERFKNQELRNLTENGDYLFVDNHFVYNAPQYVQTSADGRLELTDYALAHMDECCLVFDLKIKNNINKDYQTVCFLNRDESDVTFEVSFHNELKTAPKEKQTEHRKNVMAEVLNIRREMTDDPTKCLKQLLAWRNVKQNELAYTIGRDPTTISRIINGKNEPDLKTVVLICFALHLPPCISSKLLETFNIRLSPTNEIHQWIQEALHVKYGDSIEAAVEYLEPYIGDFLEFSKN